MKAVGLAAMLLFCPALAAAQVNPALAGTWTLNAAGEGGGRGGAIPGVPQATELVIRISSSEVTVDSNTGSARSMQTAVYRLDGSQTTVPGPLGWDVKAKAAVDAGRLVVTTRRSLDGPNGPVGVDITDSFDVAGDVLTVERTQGRNRQKLVYNRK